MALHADLTREIDEGPAGPAVGAFFDVDGTLIAGFSAVAFLRDRLASDDDRFALAVPQYDDFRPGDIRFSCASIEKARRLLAFQPTHDVAQGLAEALDWYLSREGATPAREVAAVRRHSAIAATRSVSHYPGLSLTPAP